MAGRAAAVAGRERAQCRFLHSYSYSMGGEKEGARLRGDALYLRVNSFRKEKETRVEFFI